MSVTERAMRLMIVDNDPVMREVIRHIVARPEDEVVECSDGDEVLGAYGSFHADWVLMDIHMQRLDGLKATRELKRTFPEARVAILTQYTDDEYRDEARIAGADKYLLKDNLSSIRESLLIRMPGRPS